MGKSMRGDCLIGLILFLFTSVVVAEESFPYKVTIKASDASVRSGPGSKFYATARLTKGDKIEVYQRKAGGWLAVRPPDRSFNWVEANKLRMTNDPDVAKVVGNNVVAWVGSEVDGVEDHKWQVKLDPGESVQLMSRQSKLIFRGDKQRDFYQIAPPAGEFRWIHERELEPLVEKTTTIEARSDIQLAEFQVPDDLTDISTRTDGFVARDDSSAETPAARVASLAPRTSFRPSEARGESFEALAKLLDLELSETVSNEPSQWKLASLQRDAETLLEQSETTLHRGKARLMLEKIKEFERLQLRYAGVEAAEIDASRSPDQTAGPPTASDSLSGFDPRFDGRGWLLPVHSSRQASPPYALLNQQGQILTFVSPAPGLNLHRYLRKEIGIFGQRSRAEFLNKPHLTADRIVDIERHRR
ncbi:MAG: SH3 domain-containing protein [Planctomycetes bacterium]|nr:SH3 domain-containing protein [Planctomycetota bacterium]